MKCPVSALQKATLARVTPGLLLHPEGNLLSEGQRHMLPFHGLCPWTGLLQLSRGGAVLGRMREVLRRLHWLRHFTRDAAHERRGDEETLKVSKVLLMCSGPPSSCWSWPHSRSPIPSPQHQSPQLPRRGFLSGPWHGTLLALRVQGPSPRCCPGKQKRHLLCLHGNLEGLSLLVQECGWP